MFAHPPKTLYNGCRPAAEPRKGVNRVKQQTLDVATLSLIRKKDGSHKVIQGFLAYGEEIVIFSVTVLKRDGFIFVRDTLDPDHLDLRDETSLFNQDEPARSIVERVFDHVRERWEKEQTYATSV